MRRKHQPGCPCCEPVITCPTTLTVRVRASCHWSTTGGSPVAGATVTAVDRAGLLDDVTETTDADGTAELVLDDGGGSFDVTVELPDGCTETVEAVGLLPCERKTLPDVAPCCGEVCVEAYDYDTGSPVAGATVFGSATTDSGGIACTRPVSTQDAVGGLAHTIEHPDYLPFNSMRVCLPCDCTPEAVAVHPTALFARATYVTGTIGMWTTNLTDPGAPCYQEADCLTARVVRPRTVYKRTMYAEIAGAEPIFGAGGGSTTLELVDPEATWKRWEGIAPSAGYGYKVTRTFTPGSGFVETARERFDFPVARIALFSEPTTEGARAGLQFTNYLDEAGTIPARPGHVFEASGTPGTAGYTEVVLEAERYCPLAGDPSILMRPFPMAVVNYRALNPGGTSQEDVCGDVDAWGLPKWAFDGSREVFPSGAILGGGRSGTCTPVDVAGVFWCGRDCPGAYGGGGELLATYAVYE